MRFLATISLALGLAIAAPVETSEVTDPYDPYEGIEPLPYGVCSYRDRLNARVADFTSWITECGDNGGHTTGLKIAWQGFNGLCFPLPNDTRSLEVHWIAKGCRVTVFESPICSDYPWPGAYREEAGCLWTGNREYHSYMVSCENDKEILG
ncbi:hypothetical protein OQA88_13139 [Cercophora sp. LCS_1]